MSTENTWLCWSPRQNALHLESVADGLRTNQQAFARSAKVDYVPIGIFPTEEAAYAAAAKLRPILHARERSDELSPA